MQTSLVIPVYNDEKLIKKLLDSLLTQTKVPDEIIFCDNNCTDKSIDIVKQYLHKIPIKIIKEKKQGIIPAMNTLCKKASGDLILRTDTDAILPPFWVEKISNHFIKDPCLDACGGKWFSSDGGFIIKSGIVLLYPLFDIFHFLLKGQVFLSGCNFAIKKSVLKKIGYYHSKIKTNCDDQLIGLKLKKGNYKIKRFSDCWVLHSTRRWNENPLSGLKEALGFINMKQYQLRS